MHLVMRADSGREVGYGHVRRCLALSEAARRAHAEVLFVVDDQLGCSMVEGAGVEVRNSNERSWASDIRTDSVVVFDGYGFGPEDFELARGANAAVVAFDDLGQRQGALDAVVNPSSLTASYPLPPSALVMLGPRWAMVKSSFPTRPRKPSREGDSAVVVTLGASDPAGLTEPVAKACSAHGGFDRVIVVVGPGAPALPSNLDADIVHDPPEMADIFAEAAAAVSAAGTTTWELLSMGIPTLLLQTADNQAEVIRTVDALEIALTVDPLWPLDEAVGEGLDQLANPAVRRRLGERARTVVDGKGADRLVSVLDDLSYSRRRSVCVEPAHASDSASWWRWRNDPEARAASFQRDPIPLADHAEWFQSSLENPNRRLLIVKEGSQAVGYVRLDRMGANREWIVSLAIDSARRGRALAVPALRAARSWLAAREPVELIVARIRPENDRSLHVFASAGWRQVKTEPEEIAMHWSFP